MSHSLNAAEALVAYGYLKDGDSGIYTRGNTQAWRETPDGWERFDPPGGRSFTAPGVEDPAAGAPWGVLVPEVGWYRVPYKLMPKWATVSGLHPATHPECFDWLWPEQEVAEQYTLALAANGPEGNQFIRIDGVLAHKDDIAE